MPLPQTDSAATQTVDFRGLYYLLRERLWLLVVCLLLAGFATAAYLTRAPRIYSSKAVVQVEQEEAKVINIQGVQQENLQSQEFLKTVEQTLQSRSLLERILETNKLAQDKRFTGPPGEVQPTKEALISRLAGMVDVKLRRGTRLIDIQVEHANPELTELIANQIVKQYMVMNYEQTANASQSATDFLVTEANELKTKLENSEGALQAYRETTKSASLEERQNIVVEKLKELSLRVTEAKSQRITHEAAYRQVEAHGTNIEALLTVFAVANDPTIKEIRTAIAREETEIANMKQRYRDKHPKYLQAQSKLAEWKNTLQKAVLNVPQTIRSAYENSRTAEQALETALREQETAALDLNKQSIRYNVLAREVESDRAMYQAVLNRIKETSLTKDLHPNKIRIIQNAAIPEFPVKPQPVKVAIFGIIAGLLGGIMLVLLLHALDNTLKTVDETEQFLGLPVLSGIPKFKESAFAHKLIMADDAQSTEAESFRTLRTAVSMLGRKEDRKTFLFTSALPAEGKTFCSLNFAVSLAQQGLRTLVIDCDLRRPSVEKTLLKTHKRSTGVTDYLTGNKTFNDLIKHTDVDNLCYIPAGTDAPNPAELLAQKGIDALLEDALKQFDRVVIDSAPIHAVSDTLLIVNRVQTACVVIRARKTPRNAIRRAVQLLREAGAPLAGTILNMQPRGRLASYYYDGYYNYAYQGYYAQKKQPKALAA